MSVSCVHPGAQAMANASKPSNAGFRCESIILLLSGAGRGVGILRQCYDVRRAGNVAVLWRNQGFCVDSESCSRTQQTFARPDSGRRLLSHGSFLHGGSTRL